MNFSEIVKEKVNIAKERFKEIDGELAKAKQIKDDLLQEQARIANGISLDAIRRKPAIVIELEEIEKSLNWLKGTRKSLLLNIYDLQELLDEDIKEYVKEIQTENQHLETEMIELAEQLRKKAYEFLNIDATARENILNSLHEFRPYSNEIALSNYSRIKRINLQQILSLEQKSSVDAELLRMALRQTEYQIKNNL